MIRGKRSPQGRKRREEPGLPERKGNKRKVMSEGIGPFKQQPVPEEQVGQEKGVHTECCKERWEREGKKQNTGIMRRKPDEPKT